MDFTFGIVTSGGAEANITKIIESIISNNIPNYEIIIVGDVKLDKRRENENIIFVAFDESERAGWITRKKNRIVSIAKYENIVLLHDYICFAPDWYSGFIKFGNNFEWCVTKIVNTNGARYRDYTLFPHEVPFLGISYSPGKDIDSYFNKNCLLPYNFKNNEKTNKYMYISGAYYVIKKSIAEQYPLDEKLVWGRGEDVELSKRLGANGIKIQCNSLSTVHLLRYKDPIYWEHEISPEYVTKLTNML